MAYTAINDPEAYFQAVLYTGNGSTQSVTLPGDTDMQPDLVWIKRRDDDSAHTLLDAVRGGDKQLFANTTGAEDDNDETVTAFGSDGFTVGTNGGVNGDTRTYVAFCWKESATAGFDIVAFTTSGDDENHSHSLSAKPHFIILKPLTTANWITQQKGTDGNLADDYMLLHATDAEASDGSFAEPTTSVFSTSNNIAPDADHIAYLWTSIQGYSKIGRYTGNANADGTFVYTGFRPAWVLIKRHASQNWIVFNNKTLGYNPANNYLEPNTADAEATATVIDLLSNGFKARNTDGDWNAADEYLYVAFAEAPFVNSEGVPNNAR